MGLFDKLKNILKKEDTSSYEKGLEKTRNEFTSKLNILSNKETLLLRTKLYNDFLQLSKAYAGMSSSIVAYSDFI